MSSPKKQAVEMVTLKEAVKMLGLSPVWVRRMCKEGKLVSQKIPVTVETEGGSYEVVKIYVSRTSIEAKLRELQAGVEHREAVRAGTIEYSYQRPSQRTISMMRSKAARDSSLTEEERLAVNTLLARYEGEWDAEYLAKVAEQTANQS